MTGSPSNIPLTLTELLGSVFRSIVDSQVASADATLDFINRVGFVGATETSMGQLRTVAFTYNKKDGDGESASFAVELPLLGMVQIPMIAVKSAKIDFDYQVSTTEAAPATPVPDTPAARQNTTLRGGVPVSVSQRVSAVTMRGTVAPRSTGPAPAAVSRPLNEKGTFSVSVELHNGTVPTSLMRALDILELAASEKPAPGGGAAAREEVPADPASPRRRS